MRPTGSLSLSGVQGEIPKGGAPGHMHWAVFVPRLRGRARLGGQGLFLKMASGER
jgi:hypothetical protein